MSLKWKEKYFWGARVAQLIKPPTPDIGSGSDLSLSCEIKSRDSLHAELHAERGVYLGFSLTSPQSLPLPHLHVCARSLSLSLSLFQ